MTEELRMIIALASALVLGAAAVAATALPCIFCSDGWMSRSSGRGTCSWHGGIAESDE
jgi:hypothetical protein